VLVIAGSEDDTVKGLVEKTQPLADGKRVQLKVVDGADHFFRDLYAEDVADAVQAMLDGG
jgi:alpha/beta superfamily hydrolase